MARDKDRYSRDQRFEVILDNGEDYYKWSDLNGNVANVASGTEHVTASRSVSFDKVDGPSKDAYIVRKIGAMNGVNLDAFSSEGQILSSVYLSDVSDVSSYNIALLMASGTDNATFYKVNDTELTAGWNHLKMDCNTYSTISGCGADWTKIKYLGVGVSFDNDSDTLSDILVDSVRMQMPSAVFNFEPTIDNVTMSSGVEITDGSDTLDLLRADDAPTVATITVPTKPVDAQGNVITGGGGTSGGLTLYTSPVHFTATYQAATALDLSGMSFSITDFSQFVEIEAWDASAGYIAKYTPKSHVFSWDSTNDRVTVAGAAFVSGGTYKVSVLAPDRTISLPDDAVKTLVGNHYPLVSDSAGVSILSSAQDLTTPWADLGPEIYMFGYNSLGVWLNVDANDSADIRVRALAKHTSGGSEEFPLSIESVGSSSNVVRVNQYYWEFEVDEDAQYILLVRTEGVVPYVQLQVQHRANIDSTAGQIDTAYYTRGWR